MTEEEQKKCVAQQKDEILALRKELESICEEKGYSLGQVCHGLAVDQHIEQHGSALNWDGLEGPPQWFLKATKFSEEDYWKLGSVERHKLLIGFIKR